MTKCPLCGKELKHKGALNGHLAFAHGVVTEKEKTINELREEVVSSREQMDLLYSCFKPYPDKNTGRETKGLITYDRISHRVHIFRKFDAENGEFTDDGITIVQGRIAEERTIVQGRIAEE